MKYTTTNKGFINVKIPIETNEYLREFIFKNINMRRKIWNDFVEEANKFKDEYNNYYGFKPKKFKTEYFHNVEIPENRYEEYCVGLSEQVTKDIEGSLERIKTNNKKVLSDESSSNLSSLHFKKRDNYYGSFKVKTKNTRNKNNGNFRGSVKVIDNSTIKFKVRWKGYVNKEKITLKLLESLYHDYDNDTKEYIRYYYDNKDGNKHECRFMMNDIKEISFIHNLGTFYIQLSIKVRFHININEVSQRLPKLGIDTGIHNPFMMYDGKRFFSIRMDQKTANKIHYLERRAGDYKI